MNTKLWIIWKEGMKPEQSEVNLLNAKCPLSDIRHKFKRKHMKGLECLDVYVTNFSYKESCAFLKIYSLTVLTDDSSGGPKQNSLIKVKYLISQEFNTES